MDGILNQVVKVSLSEMITELKQCKKIYTPHTHKASMSSDKERCLRLTRAAEMQVSEGIHNLIYEWRPLEMCSAQPVHIIPKEEFILWRRLFQLQTHN